MNTIPLKWIKNNIDSAKFAFKNTSNGFTYLGAPIIADFDINYESLAEYVTDVLDKASLLEGCGINVALVEIKDKIVKVW